MVNKPVEKSTCKTCLRDVKELIVQSIWRLLFYISRYLSIVYALRLADILYLLPKNAFYD